MLRLARDGASSREIARVLGVARSTVQENLKRAMDAGLSWPLPGDLTDDALEQRLFARAGVKQGTRRRPEPNWAELVIDLKKPGVTMMVLWEEYRAIQPDGYGYSRFCELFRGFERRLSAEHAAGSCRRRQGLRRLLRQEDRHRRSAHRRDPRGGDLRRRARRLELHLRRGDLDPVAAGLDRCARPDVPLLRRRAAPGGARQPEVRRPQGLVLRSRSSTAATG